MIRTVDKADDIIADMVWWLKGFAAARPPSIDEGDGSHLWLRDQLGEVRQYLGAIEDGRVRRIGEESAVVFTFAEFEKLVEAFAPSATFADIATGRDTLRVVLEEYQAESSAARQAEEVPF